MIYFVNENLDPRIVCSIDLYKNKQVLLYEHEPWYEKVGHLIFDMNGTCFRMISTNDVLSLKRLETKVHATCVERFVKFFESRDALTKCLDMDLYPKQIELIEDCNDYVVEETSPPKHKFLSKWKFW